jgi:hypothetical protein
MLFYNTIQPICLALHCSLFNFNAILIKMCSYNFSKSITTAHDPPAESPPFAQLFTER